MKISILLPTRRRYYNMIRLMNSLRETSTVMPEVIAYIDDDDETVNEVRAIEGVTVLYGPRMTLAKYWNVCLKYATGDILMQCGDDVIFRTKGWDGIVISAFENYLDKIILVHGDDGFQPSTFGTHVFLHRNWVNAVGYFSPPYFESDFCDTWLNHVANEIGRRIHVPIMTEHMHPVAKKAEWDQTHQERLAREREQNPQYIYNQLAPERERDIEKLRKVIKGNL